MVIYRIRNIINNKSYIGQTRLFNPYNRILSHFKAAEDNKIHPLSSSIRKYGKDAFEITILQECGTLEELDEAEIFWIAELDTLHENNNGYNLRKGGSGGGEITNETRLKISKSKKGVPFSEKGKQNLSKNSKVNENYGHSGFVHSEEIRQKISINTILAMTEEIKEKIKIGMDNRQKEDRRIINLAVTLCKSSLIEYMDKIFHNSVSNSFKEELITFPDINILRKNHKMSTRQIAKIFKECTSTTYSYFKKDVIIYMKELLNKKEINNEDRSS